MLKKIIIFGFTNQTINYIMAIKDACYRHRCLLDFLTLMVFIVLLGLLSNLIFDFVTTSETITVSSTVADLRASFK